MSAGDEHLVVEQLRAIAVQLRVGRVADVVAVLLEPADHLVFRVEEVRSAAVGVQGAVERPVVGDGVGRLVRRRIPGRTGDRARVEAVAAVVVVRLPGRIGGCQQDVGVALLVAHDEHDLAVASLILGVVSDEVGDVDARDRVARHRPGRRHGPVAAVDLAGRGVVEARRLALRKRRRRLHRGDDLPRAVAPVVAEPEDVDVVVARRRVDLEVLGLARLDAHRGREPLDRGVARSVDLPVARRIAGQLVLAHDRVGGAGGQRRRGPARRDREERDGERQREADADHA